jgi:hypothetical protein
MAVWGFSTGSGMFVSKAGAAQFSPFFSELDFRFLFGKGCVLCACLDGIWAMICLVVSAVMLSGSCCGLVVSAHSFNLVLCLYSCNSVLSINASRRKLCVFL